MKITTLREWGYTAIADKIEYYLRVQGYVENWIAEGLGSTSVTWDETKEGYHFWDRLSQCNTMYDMKRLEAHYRSLSVLDHLFKDPYDLFLRSVLEVDSKLGKLELKLDPGLEYQQSLAC